MSRASLSIPQAPARGAAVPPDKPGDGSLLTPRGGASQFEPSALDVSEGGVLSLGEGISVQGTIVGARRIVIAGTFDSQQLATVELVIGRTGVFRGEADVTKAELDGRLEGVLTVNGHLAVLANCRFVGSARYESLSVQPGGTLDGDLAVLREPVR